MSVKATEQINASSDIVWQIVTDIDNAADNIKAITDARVLERPESGLIGLKWQETRVMFGKEATETMWISAAEDGKWYETTANNCGAIYTSRVELKDLGGSTELSMSFSAQPVSLSARLFSVIGFLFTASIKKAFAEDLKDIKRLAEKAG